MPRKPPRFEWCRAHSRSNPVLLLQSNAAEVDVQGQRTCLNQPYSFNCWSCEIFLSPSFEPDAASLAASSNCSVCVYARFSTSFRARDDCTTPLQIARHVQSDVQAGGELRRRKRGRMDSSRILPGTSYDFASSPTLRCHRGLSERRKRCAL